MFTGLVECTGRVIGLDPGDGGLDLTLEVPWTDLQEGESVAVNGACLTVTRQGPCWFKVHLVSTTLERTCFSALQPGSRVNLERALRLGDRLGGHLVSGHVDGIGMVVRVSDRDDARLIEIALPPEVAEITIPLGSITVDGVSLTVNALLDDNTIQLSIIPFTLEHTTLSELKPGDQVQLEGDLMGKYLRRMANFQNRGE